MAQSLMAYAAGGDHACGDARRGALAGLAATGGVITSAGFELAGTFAVLGTIPSTFLTEIGFAVTFGILLDTFIVRSVLVTALNLDLGQWMWWRAGWHTSPTRQRRNSAKNAPPP